MIVPVGITRYLYEGKYVFFVKLNLYLMEDADVYELDEYTVEELNEELDAIDIEEIIDEL